MDLLFSGHKPLSDIEEYYMDCVFQEYKLLKFISSDSPKVKSLFLQGGSLTQNQEDNFATILVMIAIIKDLKRIDKQILKSIPEEEEKEID